MEIQFHVHGFYGSAQDAGRHRVAILPGPGGIMNDAYPVEEVDAAKEAVELRAGYRGRWTTRTGNKVVVRCDEWENAVDERIVNKVLDHMAEKARGVEERRV